MIENIDPRAILKKSLARGGRFADLFIEHATLTTIRLEAGKIEEIVSGIRHGAGVRVIHNMKTAYSYTNSVVQDTLDEIAGTVSHAVRESGAAPEVMDLNTRDVPRISPIKVPVDGVALSDKVAHLRAAETAARKVDKRIRQVMVLYGDRVKKIAVVNSEGLMVEDECVHSIFYVQAVAADDEGLQVGYEPFGGAMGYELFEQRSAEEIAVIAAKRAVQMLESRPAPGGAMPVVLSSEAGGTMIHEAIGHGLEADLAEQGLSVYSDKLGTQVASPLISVVDDATLPGRRGSFGVDDEGSPSEKTILVEKGILKTYMYDRLQAMKEGKASTGNGRRESFEYRPIVRMSNTLILPGESDPASIVASVDKGLLVKRMGGGQVNTVNGDFVFDVEEGYMIQNGKVGEAVRGATLTGNGPQVLQTIDMVGNDLGFGIGTCGKDGQGVPVADAQPTLRIPEIIIGGA